MGPALIQRSRAKSSQKISTLSSADRNGKRVQSGVAPSGNRRRIISSISRKLLNDDQSLDEDYQFEEVAAAEADLEEDRRCDEDFDEDSSSACATPDIADGLDGIDAVPTTFGLAELKESHGAFFPEWTDLPNFVGSYAPSKEKPNTQEVKQDPYEGIQN